jgi:hypothetical protein
MKGNTEIKQLRSFGFIVGGIFTFIGLWSAWFHGTEYRLWALIVGGLLIVPALVFPTALALPHKGWMALSEVLGWINTRIILGVIFFALLTPIGIIRRMLGKDPMGRDLKPETNTYRILRQPRPGSHMTRQY